MNPQIEEPPPNLVARTGIEPVRDDRDSHANATSQAVAPLELFGEASPDFGNRPQSSPIPRRLSRQDIRDLLGILHREIGYTGISSDPGKRALVIIEKLKAIHAHGWQ